MDLTFIGGIAGALGGVFLGSWLSGRSQRELLDRTHLREQQKQREQLYAEVLVAWRTYRVFLTTQAESVRLGALTSAGYQVPIVENSREYADAVQIAFARLQVLDGPDSSVVEAARRLQRTFDDVARARVGVGPGEVPADIMVTWREAELHYARTAHERLSGLGQNR